MKNAILSKVGRGNTYTKKSLVHALSAAHTCFSLGAYAIYLFFEKVSSIWQAYWLWQSFRSYMTLNLLIMVRKREKKTNRN